MDYREREGLNSWIKEAHSDLQNTCTVGEHQLDVPHPDMGNRGLTLEPVLRIGLVSAHLVTKSLLTVPGWPHLK